jgi:16S rRNA (guanine966-N2)-methyltransferase
MKINFGLLKGRKLSYKVSANVEKNVRPTTSIVKSSLFNLIMHNEALSSFDIKNSSVADFCCGTGSIGFEFLSLGATNCTFFDESHENLENVNANAKNLNILDKVSIKAVDLLNTKYANKIVDGKFDIIFFDPPYGKTNEIMTSFMSLIKNKELLKPNGLIIVESNRAVEVSDFTKILERKVRKDRVLTFLC